MSNRCAYILLKAVGAIDGCRSRRVTRQVWVLENKNLTLYTSLPIIIFEILDKGGKTVMNVFFAEQQGWRAL